METNDQTQNTPPEGERQGDGQGPGEREGERRGERRGRSRRRGGRGRSRGQRQPQGQGRTQDEAQGQEQAQGQEPSQQSVQVEGQARGQRQARQRSQGEGQGRGQDRSRPRRQGEGQGRGQGGGQGPRASKVAIIAPATPTEAAWADRIQEHLQKHIRTVTRLNVEGDAGLTERLKEARAHGAHRIVAVGDHQFIRWAAQAMVGSLMPLAPVLVPGSRPIFGYQPIPASGWEAAVEAMLSHKFAKVDMAMGTVNPFVHQLLAGFPAANGASRTSTWQVLTNKSQLKLKVQIDRSTVEGDFWCLAVANADLPDGRIRWLPGSDWADQRLDLLLVRPRSTWQKWQFLRALRRGEHGALPGVLRYRGYRITVHAEAPWRYSADGSQTQEAASPLVVEARPQMLRLVVPEGG